MAEFPSLPLFTDAYLADTRHLTTAQHGAYLLLLMTAWRDPDCSLPDDDIALARWCGMDARNWRHAKPIVMAFWRLKDGRWTQARLTDERRFLAAKREQQSAAGRASVLAKLQVRRTRNSATPTNVVIPATHGCNVNNLQDDASTNVGTNVPTNVPTAAQPPHPHPHPSTSTTVDSLNLGVYTHTQRKTPEIVRAPLAADLNGHTSQRFPEFWERYPRKQRKDFACRQYISTVSIETEGAVFACLERYRASDEVSRGVIQNPDKWLYEQHRNDWAGDWPHPVPESKRPQTAYEQYLQEARDERKRAK